MELKKFNQVSGVSLPEGESAEKVLMDIYMANEENVSTICDLFKTEGYDISIVPASFFKLFTSNAKEINDLKGRLEQIKALGIQASVQASMRSECFTDGFIARVEYAKENNISYLLEDGTLHPALFDKITFASISVKSQAPVANEVKENNIENEINTSIQEKSIDKLVNMDVEDREVYQEVQNIMHAMIMSEPENEFLPLVAKNTFEKVIDSITRKEYRFIPVNEMISNCMFDGLDVTPADMMKVEALLGTVTQNMEENKKVVGGR